MYRSLIILRTPWKLWSSLAHVRIKEGWLDKLQYGGRFKTEKEQGQNLMVTREVLLSKALQLQGAILYSTYFEIVFSASSMCHGQLSGGGVVS